eukprot:2481259-Prymnesium_polylepis.1
MPSSCTTSVPRATSTIVRRLRHRRVPHPSPRATPIAACPFVSWVPPPPRRMPRRLPGAAHTRPRA